ncbi:MAG: SseB family protein, partial [Alphaproteobacteria bacterium]
MSRTPLDDALARLAAAPEAEEARRAFWERLLACELWLILAEEPAPGAALRPLLLPTAEGPVALAFSAEARMAGFLTSPAPCAVLSGRRLVAALAGQGVLLGVDLGTDAPGTLQPPEAIAWAAAHAAPVAEVAGRVAAVGPPRAGRALLAALDARLASLTGRGEEAWLAHARHADGTEGLVLALTGVAEADRPAVIEALAEAFRLSGEAGMLDILFPDRLPEAFR